MQKKIVAVVGLVLIVACGLVAGMSAKPETQPTTSQPAASQPSRNLTRIDLEIGSAWEEVNDILDQPDWDAKSLIKCLTKLTELKAEHDQRVAEIHQKLLVKARERVEEIISMSRRIETEAPILTPEQEVKFEKWMKEQTNKK